MAALATSAIVGGLQLAGLPPAHSAEPTWSTVYSETFDTPSALGNGIGSYRNKLEPYGPGWGDTSGYGTYDATKTISVANSVLDVWLHNEAGSNFVAALRPLHPTTTYGRYSIRMRADQTEGYKIVPMLWPDSNVWNDGEIDFPEGDLDGQSLMGFNHYAGNPTQQDWVRAGVNGDYWHTYETLWSPGRVQFVVDGQVVGTSTTAVASKPLHWVLQFETEIGSGPPPASAQGHVQIDWISVAKYQTSGGTTTPTQPPSVAPNPTNPPKLPPDSRQAAASLLLSAPAAVGRDIPAYCYRKKFLRKHKKLRTKCRVRYQVNVFARR